VPTYGESAIVINMKKKYLAKFNVKDKTAKVELARAHGMIVLLVIALMFILALSSTFNVMLNPMLTFVVVLLLAIVGLISLSVVVTVLRKR
jgi:uncharacterized protein YacL